jgi:hypothetical protein
VCLELLLQHGAPDEGDGPTMIEDADTGSYRQFSPQCKCGRM